MFSKSSVSFSVLFVLFCALVACVAINFSTSISAQPTASIGNLFGGTANKIEHNESERKEAAAAAAAKDPAEQSFKAFINSKPSDSTLIGEIKQNASELEKMILRAKIKNAIEVIKSENRKSVEDGSGAGARAECYIEVTRVEKVPGKCHRASSGLPICQSENYMTFSNDCK